MVNHRVFGFWRHPHATTRPLLLKVDFVQSPKVEGVVLHQFRSFFFAFSVASDRTWPEVAVACGGGTRIVGITAGIGARRVGFHTSCRSRPIASCRPRDSSAYPRRWVWLATHD